MPPSGVEVELLVLRVHDFLVHLEHHLVDDDHAGFTCHLNGIGIFYLSAQGLSVAGKLEELEELTVLNCTALNGNPLR